MQAVSIAPDLIYLDALIPPVEQVHLIHYLSKHNRTQRIPILVDEGFIQLHPGVLQLAGENAGVLKPLPSEKMALEAEEMVITENPLILGYPATSADSDQHKLGGCRFAALESIFLEGMGRKCEWSQRVPG
jgi:hypothetical protein